MSNNRPETGSMQFGEDWPGVFIRGDNANYYAMKLRTMLQGKLHQEDFISRIALDNLAKLLESSHIGYSEKAQHLREFEECLAEKPNK